MNSSENLAANAYIGLGVSAILPCFIESFISNGVSEELFFRGFLTKRLGAKFGTNAGITLQAICFGLMHNLLYLAAGMNVSFKVHLILFFFTGIGALLLGFLNEKVFNGSIVPSILLHGLGNFIATVRRAFL